MADNTPPKVWDAVRRRIGLIERPQVEFKAFSTRTRILTILLHRRAWPISSGHGCSPFKFVFNMGPFILITPQATVTAKEPKAHAAKVFAPNESVHVDEQRAHILTQVAQLFIDDAAAAAAPPPTHPATHPRTDDDDDDQLLPAAKKTCM